MNSLLRGVERAREHYTYEGVMRQIEAFLKDPFGSNGGDPPTLCLLYMTLLNRSVKFKTGKFYSYLNPHNIN